MLEIEIKSYCKSHEEVESKLLKLGAKELETVFEEDTYFQHPSRDFKESGEAFRIRRIDQNYFITYKGPKVNTKSKTRYEAETGIADGKVARDVFERLGFVEAGRVTKDRKTYSFSDIEICIDNVHGLGKFVELEKIGEDYEKDEKDLFALAEKLDLNEFTSRSYLSLLMEKSV